jgi:hypothetical protein
VARRALILALLVSLAAAAPAAASRYVAPNGSGALFLFSGHGFGHGVGMSQYGAYGYAQHGYTYDQILAHYYPGTTLGTSPVTTIRVLLANKKAALTISSDHDLTVTDGNGATHTLRAGKTKLGPKLLLAADGQPAAPLAPPLRFSPADGSTLTLGRAYRGQILVDVVDGRLRAIDVVGLQDYLDGVVPAEMLFFGAKIATTYYSSTSGGETESASDVWGGVSPPYLVAVPDPYDAISPYHDWGPVPVPARTIATKLKVPGRILDAATTPNAAGRVATLDVASLAGTPAAQTTTPVPATVVRSKLGLRSTWFGVGVLSLLLPPATRVVFGAQVTLSGLVRGVDGVVVEQRNMHLKWSELSPVAPAADGTLSLVATPQITTDYRLATPDVAAAFVRVQVVPRVTVTALTATAVTGSELPALPGATVQIQQQSPPGTVPLWRTIARGRIDANGAFSVPVSLQHGTYRALVAPGHGYWPGASAAATLDG